MPRDDSDDEGGALPKRLRPPIGERPLPDLRPRNVVASHEDPFFQATMPPHLRATLDRAAQGRAGDERARHLEAMSPHWDQHAQARREGAQRRRELAEDQAHQDRVLDDLGYVGPARRMSHDRRASYASDGSGALPPGMRPPIRSRDDPRPESGVFGTEDEPHVRRPSAPPSSSRTQPAPASPSDERKKGFGKFFHRRKKSGPGGNAHSLGKGGARTDRSEVGTTSDSDSDY